MNAIDLLHDDLVIWRTKFWTSLEKSGLQELASDEWLKYSQNLHDNEADRSWLQNDKPIQFWRSYVFSVKSELVKMTTR